MIKTKIDNNNTTLVGTFMILEVEKTYYNQDYQSYGEHFKIGFIVLQNLGVLIMEEVIEQDYRNYHNYNGTLPFDFHKIKALD